MKMEVAAGLEPAKTGFADQRLDHFGIATKNQNRVPKLYPNLYPKCLCSAYLPLFKSL